MAQTETAWPTRLPTLIRASGETHESLAKRAGVDEPTVAAWADGRESIPEPHRAMLVDLFGVSVSHLLYEDKPVAVTRPPRNVDAQEDAVLRSAAADIRGWIERLPAASGWRIAFELCSLEIERVLA